MEWIWLIAIVGGIVLFMLGIELLSRRTNETASAYRSFDEDEDDDADGSDTSNADVDE